MTNIFFLCMEYKEKESLYLKNVRKYALNQAKKLCEFEFENYKKIFNSNLEFDEFKKLVSSPFIYTELELKKIYQKVYRNYMKE